ncbi:hypothetical protein [Serinicoccus sediminis]|uniref:hypothetical protein n=1 Tax=Serinicoccus sediminis TaxID=2306021 RepID=UPI001021A9A2|nr:hypothetical protein [Serinicoccus sediminis]
MGFEVMCFAVIAGLVGMSVFAAWVGNEAKKQDETVVRMTPARTADLINDSVGGLLWSRVDGEGDLNFKRRSPKGDGPTVSAQLEDLGDGRTRVFLAMTRWSAVYGFVISFGTSAWRLKRKLMKKLDEAA